MSSSPALRHAPVTVLNVLRPSPPRPSRPVPHLVSLPTMDLVEVIEVKEAKPKSVPPPLPPPRSAVAVPRAPAIPRAPAVPRAAAPRAAASHAVAPPPVSARYSERVPILRRSSSDDLLETLFEALRDLDSEPDALSAARACLLALESVVPSRAATVHAFDVTRGDFIVVDAQGEAAETMVLQRSSKDDPLLRVAIPNGEPFPWNDLRKAPVARLARFSGLPHVARVLVCPVLAGARWLGAIELIDPTHDRAFRSEDVIAARYVAQRYAEYVSSHGMVLDVAAIARHAFRP
jgi:hypothetical protein